MQIERLDVRRGGTLPYPPPVAPRNDRRAAPRGGRTLPCRFGRYMLFDHIGQGGMADIYLARVCTDLGAARLAVIKEVIPMHAQDERFAEMLVREAKLAAELRHAAIVQVEELGREGASLYIAMEYVEGFDLRELLRRCAREKVKLPVGFSLLVVSEVLRALAYAHRMGVVHRDVSPSNVLLSFEGEIKLCDFGIARAHELRGGTLDEALQGKAGYMSPEQARGAPVDARSDVFAVGILLWELLAGRRMYGAGRGAGLSKEEARDELLDLARRAHIPPLVERGLPDEARLHAIVARALAEEREDRYPSADVMLRDLTDYAAAAGLAASPLRFGAWICESFGTEIVATRRARERAARALALGPPAVIVPITAAPASPSPWIDAQRATTPLRPRAKAPLRSPSGAASRSPSAAASRSLPAAPSREPPRSSSAASSRSLPAAPSREPPRSSSAAPSRSLPAASSRRRSSFPARPRGGELLVLACSCALLILLCFAGWYLAVP